MFTVWGPEPGLAHRSIRQICARCALVVALFVTTTSQAIVNGEPDGKRHPFVGLIVYQVVKDGPWYAPQGGSAVLVSSRVAVTAGHVLETPLTVVNFGITPAQIGVVFEAVPVDLSTPPDLGAHWREVPASMVHVAESVAWHPELFASPETPNDVGVIIFKKPVKGRPFARIPRPRLFDLIERVVDLRVDMVGYGATEFMCCPPAGGGNRTSGSAPIVDLTPDVLTTGALNEGDVNGGPGDSGSGAFIGHVFLVGVLSGLSPPDAPDQPAYTFFSRTDSEAACTFLSRYLKLKCRPIDK